MKKRRHTADVSFGKLGFAVLAVVGWMDDCILRMEPSQEEGEESLAPRGRGSEQSAKIKRMRPNNRKSMIRFLLLQIQSQQTRIAWREGVTSSLLHFGVGMRGWRVVLPSPFACFLLLLLSLMHICISLTCHKVEGKQWSGKKVKHTGLMLLASTPSLSHPYWEL